MDTLYRFYALTAPGAVAAPGFCCCIAVWISINCVLLYMSSRWKQVLTTTYFDLLFLTFLIDLFQLILRTLAMMKISIKEVECERKALTSLFEWTLSVFWHYSSPLFDLVRPTPVQSTYIQYFLVVIMQIPIKKTRQDSSICEIFSKSDLFTHLLYQFIFW